MDPHAALLLKRIMERYLMPREKWVNLPALFPDTTDAMDFEEYDYTLVCLARDGYIGKEDAAPDSTPYFIPTPLADQAEEQGLLDAIPPSNIPS